MAVEVRAAKRYALALFRTASANDVVKSVESDLDGIANLLRNDPAFKEFILSPHVNREEKIAILDKLFGDRVTAMTMTALRLVVEKGREPEIEAIRNHFVLLRRQKEGVVHCMIETSETLDNDQRMSLEMKLARSLGVSVEAEYAVEPSLGGGIRVTYDNFVLDGSVKGKLKKLRELLRHDLLKQA